jgi:hypothetical protein
MKTFWKWLIFQYNSIHNYIHFWAKKREADQLHATHGKRYHVVPTGPRKLEVVDNDYVDRYNRLVPKNKRITYLKLIKMSYYSTPVQPLTQRKK